MDLKKYEYYRTDLGVLYNCDCLMILPHLEPVDLVLTDPPYGISVGGAKGVVGGANIVSPAIYGHCKWDKQRPSKNYFDAMFFVSKNQIIFGGNYFIDYLYPTPCFIIWDKDNTGNFADAEIAWASFKTAVRIFVWKWNGIFKEFPERRYHITQKPVGLFMLILRKYGKDEQTTLDPFLGSGTTAIACERLNRRWIGIEIEEKYCEIAAKRIEQEAKQLKMFR